MRGKHFYQSDPSTGMQHDQSMEDEAQKGNTIYIYFLASLLTCEKGLGSDNKKGKKKAKSVSIKNQIRSTERMLHKETSYMHREQLGVTPTVFLRAGIQTSVNPCTWFHVTCNNDNTVIRVDLGNAGISGFLFLQLGGLKNHQYLELFGNNISETIPAALGNLTNLVCLDLYNNSLTASIPSSLGNLMSLKYL